MLLDASAVEEYHRAYCFAIYELRAGTRCRRGMLRRSCIRCSRRSIRWTAWQSYLLLRSRCSSRLRRERRVGKLFQSTCASSSLSYSSNLTKDALRLEIKKDAFSCTHLHNCVDKGVVCSGYLREPPSSSVPTNSNSRVQTILDNEETYEKFEANLVKL